jgi:hypothetical protein
MSALSQPGPRRLVRPLSYGVGIVGLCSTASLATFFAAGEPFGTINDWLIGVTAVLGGALVLVAERTLLDMPHAGRLLAGAAVAGAAVVAAGSALVLTGTTGFFLAGLVQSVGFALLGAWLLATSRAMARSEGWHRRLTALGTGAGALMVVGLVAVPGVLLRVDDVASAPAWVWIAEVSWLGIFFAYPLWAIALGRHLRAPQRARRLGGAAMEHPSR